PDSSRLPVAVHKDFGLDSICRREELAQERTAATEKSTGLSFLSSLLFQPFSFARELSCQQRFDSLVRAAAMPYEQHARQREDCRRAGVFRPACRLDGAGDLSDEIFLGAAFRNQLGDAMGANLEPLGGPRA